MEDQRIIYKDADGTVRIMIPAPQCLETRTIVEIARKDVPAGQPYKIIHKSELPDHEFMAAWEIDDAELTDGEGSESNEFEEIH